MLSYRELWLALYCHSSIRTHLYLMHSPPPSLYPRLLSTRSNKMTLDVVLQNERYLPGNRLLHRRDTPVDPVEH